MLACTTVRQMRSRTMPTQPTTNPSVHATHQVFNQPPPLVDYNVFERDAALVEGLRREGAAWAEEELRDLGHQAGGAEAIGWGFEANRHTPELRTHDRYGNRIDEV